MEKGNRRGNAPVFGRGGIDWGELVLRASLVFVSLVLFGLDAQGVLIINNGLAPPNPENVITSSVADSVNVHNVNCSAPNPGCPAPGDPTTVHITAGASISGAVIVFETSSLEIEDGSVGGIVGALDSAHVSVIGGTIVGNLASAISGSVSYSGGAVAGNLGVSESSTLDWTGGTAGGLLLAREDGVITVYGSDFLVDGSPFAGGPLAGTSGTVSGVLASGQSFTNAFERDPGATIRLVPEAQTMLMVFGGLASLLLGRRKPR